MISNMKSRTNIIADGIQYDFYFEFDIWEPAGMDQILLFLKGSDGIVTQITDRSKLNIDLENKKVTYPYSASSSEVLTPVEKGKVVIIARYLPLQQTSDFLNKGIIPETIEATFDYEMMTIQQIEAGISELMNGYDINDIVDDIVNAKNAAEAAAENAEKSASAAVEAASNAASSASAATAAAASASESASNAAGAASNAAGSSAEAAASAEEAKTVSNIYRDFVKCHFFTKIKDNTPAVVPAPNYHSYSSVAFDIDISFIFSKSDKKYSATFFAGSTTLYIDQSVPIKLESNLYLAAPIEFPYPLYDVIFTSYMELDDVFANVSATDFEYGALVYSAVENRFCTATDTWSPVAVGYLGKYLITMGDTQAEYSVKTLRKGRTGLSLWPYDPLKIKPETVEDLTSTGIVLEAPLEGTEYIYGTLESLEIQYLYNNEFPIKIAFTSGETPTSLILPAGYVPIGALPNIDANCRYNIVIENGEVAVSVSNDAMTQ